MIHLAADLALLSWIYWGVWVLMFLAWEIPALFLEKRHKMLPLTRVARDRLMRKYTLAKLAGLLLLAWLPLHFLLDLDW